MRRIEIISMAALLAMAGCNVGNKDTNSGMKERGQAVSREGGGIAGAHPATPQPEGGDPNKSGGSGNGTQTGGPLIGGEQGNADSSGGTKTETYTPGGTVEDRQGGGRNTDSETTR